MHAIIHPVGQPRSVGKDELRLGASEQRQKITLAPSQARAMSHAHISDNRTRRSCEAAAGETADPLLELTPSVSASVAPGQLKSIAWVSESYVPESLAAICAT